MWCTRRTSLRYVGVLTVVGNSLTGKHIGVLVEDTVFFFFFFFFKIKIKENRKEKKIVICAGLRDLPIITVANNSKTATKYSELLICIYVIYIQTGKRAYNGHFHVQINH